MLFFLALVPARFLPAEDAVILFQYSRNLAEHGAITFLAGGPHVEGATDFAWMVLVAGAMKFGVAPFWFCAAVNVVSLGVLGWLLLRMAGIRWSVGLALAIAGAAGLFPQMFAAAAGFAVLPDAVLLTLLVWWVVERRVTAAAFTAFVFCLFRPDGVVFAVPLLASLLIWPEEVRRSRVLLRLVWFVVPGVLYFVWRCHYFGELFPLPFLVKSDTPRVLGLLVPRSMKVSLMFLAFAGIVLATLRLGTRIKIARLMVGLMVLPTLFYWTVRLDQNVGYRFFYYLPVATAILIALNWPALQPHRVVVLRVAFGAWLVLLAMPLYRELRTFRDGQFVEVKGIAEELGRMPVRGTILTSEAGFLPYYSGWTTYDAWGLNTPEFAHRFFEAEDVGGLHADLVVLHPDRPERCVVEPDWEPNYAGRSWQHLTRNLSLGATASGYELWLTSYGSEFYRQRKGWGYGEGDGECWFVRRGSPLYAGVVEVLQRHHAVSEGRATP